MDNLYPLYPEAPTLAVEGADPLDADPDCERCTLHKVTRNTRCMSPEGEPGGLLIVSDYPGRDEDISGRPMYGRAGRFLRSLLQKHWRGPIAFDNALRCAPFSKKVTVAHINACRSYLAQTFAEVKPQRVIAAGTQAIHSILGNAVPPFSVRRGYTWLTKTATPVFLMMNPAAAVRNRFVRQWFEEDLQWALTADTKEMRRKAEWNDSWLLVVRSEDDAKAALSDAAKAEFIAYDAETAGRHWEDGTNEPFDDGFLEPAFRVLCVSFCGAKDSLVWTWDAESLRDPLLLSYLKRIMEDPGIQKVGQNEKFDRHCMRALGIDVAGYKLDTRLVRRIIDPEASGKLEVMQHLVGMGGGKDEMKEATSKVVRRIRKGDDVAGPADLVAGVKRDHCDHERYSYGLVDHDLMLRYNAADSLSTARLGVLVGDELVSGPDALQDVWHKLVHPLSLAITQVERWGVAVDRGTVEAFQSLLMLKQQESGSRVHLLAKNLGIDEFNPGSVKQMRELLFERLKLRPTKRTKTGLPSTDRSVLDALAHRHEIIADIVALREVTKLRGTYADPLPGHIRADGRVHPSIKLDGARSGRDSCESPNLYNVPRVESEEGKMARDCFFAPEGTLLVNFDFSQIELRVAAIESGDPLMRELFESGDDYHYRTAQLISKQMWGIEPEDVPKKGEERTAAKSIVFGVIYGMGPVALAATIGCSVAEAERVSELIMGKFKKLKRYCKKQLRNAQRDGVVWTTWEGKPFRRRPMWRVADSDSESRSRAEHGTTNTPIQGKGSDYCAFSLVECIDWLRRDAVPAKLVLKVYDSLMFEVREDALDEVLAAVPEIMTQWDTGDPPVPLVVDVEVGPSWGSLQKV